MSPRLIVLAGLSLLVIPLYQVIQSLGLINNLAALWVVYPTFAIPFATWLLMGYVQSLPPEIDEAAMIDGATRIQALWRVILPIVRPGSARLKPEVIGTPS